jgi:hypothetical protein
MSESTSQTRRPRPRWRRILTNILLLPPALLYVIVENVFWAGAKGLLREASKMPVVGAMQRGLEKLPAAAVLPLFLVPEIFSHLGGLWATVLLVQRKFFLAFLVGLFIKGLATLDFPKLHPGFAVGEMVCLGTRQGDAGAGLGGGADQAGTAAGPPADQNRAKQRDKAVPGAAGAVGAAAGR